MLPWRGQARQMLTKPFYMGLFEVTQKQWELVTGEYLSSQKGETRPVDRVSYDMHGNVHEWCLDWSGLLAYGADPKGVAAGTERVHRRGAWCTDGASAIRRSDPPSFVETSRGLRLCAPAQ